MALERRVEALWSLADTPNSPPAFAVNLGADSSWLLIDDGLRTISAEIDQLNQ